MAATVSAAPERPSTLRARRTARRLLGLGASVVVLGIAIGLSVAVGSALLPIDVVWAALTAPDGSAAHATVSAARVERTIRTREFTHVEVRGQRIAVKIARDGDGAVVRREPEFRDVAAAARVLGISERTMLDLAKEAAAGLANG